MNISELRGSGSIIFEAVSGSRAYGLATENSDIDIRGVYVAPLSQFYSFDSQDQISDEKNNEVYYELKKFLDLLSKNNPSMLELLFMPSHCIKYEHPLFHKIKSINFLSLLCKDTFGYYAISQLKKARGLNKKIVNPMSKEKKSIIDFCYVLQGKKVIPLSQFLAASNLSQRDCGLVALDHMRDLYTLYHSCCGLYHGIMHHSQSMEVMLSSVPKEEEPIAVLSFNKDGYSRYCKDYREYWEWVEQRNDFRYHQTVEHGKNYDAKNMMHVFRLLGMAKEIALAQTIYVHRTDRDKLLKIREGVFEYDELVNMAQQEIDELEEIYKHSSLPDSPDRMAINQLLIDVRKAFYVYQAGS